MSKLIIVKTHIAKNYIKILYYKLILFSHKLNKYYYSLPEVMKMRKLIFFVLIKGYAKVVIMYFLYLEAIENKIVN